MKNKVTFKSLLIILLLLVLITGCSKQEKNEELKTEKYVMQSNDSEWSSWIILEENNKFIFIRHAATSYVPKGTYSINGNKLILYVSENESYEFTIEEDKLIFENSYDIDALVKKGTVFKLSN